MITEYFKNPKPVQRYVTYHNTNQTYYTPQETAMALKMGISPHTYRKRCKLVTEEWLKCKVKVGDKVFPYSATLCDQHGEMIVQAICKSYDDYGDVGWNDPPFILQVASVDKPNESISCTAGFVQHDDPRKVGEC